MPTLTGILLAASGGAFTGPILFQRVAGAVANGSGAQGSGSISSTASLLTSPGITIAPGVWVLTWWEGRTVNSLKLAIPVGSSTVTLLEVADQGSLAVSYQGVFSNPAAVRQVSIGDSVQVIFLRQDEQVPPVKNVWFSRGDAASGDDGVNVIVDAGGAEWLRASS